MLMSLVICRAVVDKMIEQLSEPYRTLMPTDGSATQWLAPDVVATIPGRIASIF